MKKDELPGLYVPLSSITAGRHRYFKRGYNPYAEIMKSCIILESMSQYSSGSVGLAEHSNPQQIVNYRHPPARRNAQ
jgi:hypothetical protein